MKHHRLIVVLFLLACSEIATAATLKIATLAPDGSDWMNRIRAGAKEVTQLTDNRVKFKFYPGGVMGDDKAVIRKMRIGQLQGAAVSSGALAQRSPDSQVYALPLKFKSFAEVDYVRSKMDQTIAEELADKGMVSLGLSEGGFAYTMSKSRVSSVADVLKQKVWAPDSDPMSLATLHAFGIRPIPLSIGDVLTGLQTGLIDTIASFPTGAIILQWHNHVDYLTDLPMVYIFASLVIDKKAFNKIPPADQPIVREVMGNALKGIDSQNRSDNKAAFEALKKQGLKFISPNPEELSTWQKMANAAEAELIKNNVISQEIVTQMDRYLNEYRAQQR